MITMDYITRLPRTISGNDTIWVIVDHLTKSTRFLDMRETVEFDVMARCYVKEVVSKHGVSVSIISDDDSHFMTGCWKAFCKALCVRSLI